MRIILLVLSGLAVGIASVTAEEPENQTLTRKLAEISKRTEQLDRDAKAKDAMVKSLLPRVDAARGRVSGANDALAIANAELEKARATVDAADPGTANPAADAAVKAKATLASRAAEQSGAEKELADA